MDSSVTKRSHSNDRRAYALVGGVQIVVIAMGIAATVLIHSVLVVAVIWGFVVANLLAGWLLVQAIRAAVASKQSPSRQAEAERTTNPSGPRRQ